MEKGCKWKKKTLVTIALTNTPGQGVVKKCILKITLPWILQLYFSQNLAKETFQNGGKGL